MIDKLRESPGRQVLLVIALITLMPLAIDINERLSTMRRMRKEEAQASQLLATAQAEQKTLQAQLDYVSSDAYLEQWARVEARMVQSGQVGIVPVWVDLTPGQDDVIQAESTSPPVDAPASIPEQWRRLFFDEPKP